MSWCAFVAGAATTALIVNYLQRAQVSNPYAVPLLIEAVLVLVFGTFGGTLQKHELIDVSLAAITLCFTMGLQNALITKISRAEIRRPLGSVPTFQHGLGCSEAAWGFGGNIW